MDHDEKVSFRIPTKLREALEGERKRMSRKAGAEVKMSAVARALFERALQGTRRPKTELAA